MAEPEEDAVEPGHVALIARLERAVNLSGVGASRSWPLEKRATFCLRVVGVGGRVSLENPSTMKSAIVALENYKG